MNNKIKRSGPACFKKLFTHPCIIYSLLAMLLLYFWLFVYSTNWYNNGFKIICVKSQVLNLREARDKAIRLQDLRLQLESLQLSKKPPSLKTILELKAVIQELHPDVMSIAESKSTTMELDQPVKTLVTVIINIEGAKRAKTRTIRLVKDFRASYPGISIITRVNNVSIDDLAFSLKGGMSSNLLVASATVNFWKWAIQKVKTKYVLVAPDIYRFSGNASSLERLLSALTNNSGISAIGGSIRNSSGHWMLGCYQTRLKNYVLEYARGYHFSHNGCVLCDYVDGPFLVETALLKRFLPDNGLERSVVWHDLFLILGGQSYGTLVCPDVMFYGNSLMDSVKMQQKRPWITLVRKWELNRIIVEWKLSRVLLKFSCTVSGISCSTKIKTTSSFTIPPCCQEEFATAVAFWDEFCRQNNLLYLLDSGTCLGATKMSDFIPWDIDGDGGYYETNYTFIKNNKKIFKQNGFLLKRFVDPVCCDKSRPNNLKRSYFQLWSPTMKLEMWGDWDSYSDAFLDKESAEFSSTPTMEIHGVWIKGPPNPGHYARKRYGHECLRHAHSWRQTWKNSSWEPYQSGAFKTCKNHDHHSCLDKFPADGNIAFQVPN